MKQKLNIAPGEVVAIDFETLYDSKTKYSLKNMTPSDYVRHPRFDPYLVAFTADSGGKFVGPPCDFDWTCLEGSHLIAHNATFDGMVLQRMLELKMIPSFTYTMDCTADMCACLGLGRSLKHAAENVLGIVLSKKVRTDMDGKTLNGLTHDEAAALFEYGGSDSDVCLELWRAKSAEWPELEREISRENRKANWGGVRINRKAAVEGLAILKAKAESALKQMPWVESGEKPNSTAALAECAKRHGIPTLKSYNKTDPAMQAWIARFAADYPFIQARLDYASTVPHIARVESVIEMMGNGDIVLFDSCYYGAHSGRCSGSPSGDDAGGARMNFFNIPKGDEDGLTHGVDLRGMLIPRQGKKFVIYDYSNIEPRVTQWIAGGTEFLALVAKENIYQATAKAMGWYPKDKDGLKYEDKKLYQLAKACLTEETLVLTDTGYKRIVDITATDRVWDGLEWVAHEGVAFNGYKEEKEIIALNGERFTKDHKVYHGPSVGECRTAETAAAIRNGSPSLGWRLSTGHDKGWTDLWKLACSVFKALAAEWNDLLRSRMLALR